MASKWRQIFNCGRDGEEVSTYSGKHKIIARSSAESGLYAAVLGVSET